jgi:hypothetical protein
MPEWSVVPLLFDSLLKLKPGTGGSDFFLGAKVGEVKGALFALSIISQKVFFEELTFRI